jgi:hypothetical protein
MLHAHAAAVNITSEGLIVSETGYAVGSLTVIEVIKNAGDDDSGPVTISYYLVNESEGSAKRVPIGTADLDSITSGGDYSSVKTFLLPLDLADGAYKFVREIMGKETAPVQQKTIRITDPLLMAVQPILWDPDLSSLPRQDRVIRSG